MDETQSTSAPTANAVQRGLQPPYDASLLQAYLYELGYLAKIDGIPGPQTTNAVRRFQADNSAVMS